MTTPGPQGTAAQKKRDPSPPTAHRTDPLELVVQSLPPLHGKRLFPPPQCRSIQRSPILTARGPRGWRTSRTKSCPLVTAMWRVSFGPSPGTTWCGASRAIGSVLTRAQTSFPGSAPRANGLDPCAYLIDLFEALPAADTVEALESGPSWNICEVLRATPNFTPDPPGDPDRRGTSTRRALPR